MGLESRDCFVGCFGEVGLGVGEIGVTIGLVLGKIDSVFSIFEI